MSVRRMGAAWLVHVLGATACGAGCTSVYEEVDALLGNSGGAATSAGGSSGTGGSPGAGGSGGMGGDAGTAGSTGSGTPATGGAGTGGSTAPICGDGHVNPDEECDDGNGHDHDGCSATCHLEGGSCDDVLEVTLGYAVSVGFQGTTVGGTIDSVACGKLGPHRIYAVNPEENGFLTASLTPTTDGFDSAVYLLDGCAASEARACADGAIGEIASIEVKANQLVYVVVGGVEPDDEGEYELNLDLAVGDDCADPIPLHIEPGTGVDLRGSTAGKGKDASCKIAPYLFNYGEIFGDVVYKTELAAAGNYEVSVDGDYSSILYARTKCGDQNKQLVCVDVPGGKSGEKFSLPVDGDGDGLKPRDEVFIWVDGTSLFYGGLLTEGPYRLDISSSPPP